MDKQEAQQQHKKYLFDVAAEVERLISKPEYAAQFRSVWQAFSKRVQSGEKVRRKVRHWFRPVSEEPSNDKDREIINYITLAVIHDHNRRPQWKQICSESVYRADSIWGWLRVWPYDRNKRHIEIYGDSIKEAETIRVEIQLALEHVKTDLAGKQPPEPEQDTTPAKHRESWLWRLYEKTLKVIIDAVLERLWPK